MDPVLALLHDLVAIDSVNPSLVPGAAGEAAVAVRVADACRAAGLAVHVTEVAPRRPNVVAVLEGRSPGRTLMLCGHTDTVGVGDAMHAPFTPAERDGRIYGRGAQDMKAGVAAMIDAARVIAARGGLARGRLVVAAVVDEEYASIGADAVVREWTADAAIVTEPTDMRLAVAHKGFTGIEITTAGVAAHGSRPIDGRDAIFRMGRVIGALELLDRDLQGGRAHPLLGTASLHASIIEGGREASTYPDACRLLMERRTIPGEPALQALDEVNAILSVLAGRDPEFHATARVTLARDSYEIDPRAELPQLMGRLAAARGGDPAPAGVSFWTDAQILSAAGIPTVVFGPGGAGLHSDEEYVIAADVIACRDLLVDVVDAYV
jgi:acetylornithine deacetylase